MKNKTKLFTIAAVTAITLGLSSCGITENADKIITFKDGSSIGVTATELYDQYKQTLNGTKAYYNAIYDIVIRHEMNKTSNEGKKAELVKKAKTKVEDEKTNASNNASTNGTSYDTELEKILTSYGVDDLDGLQIHFEGTLFKEYLEDTFYDEHLEDLLVGGEIGGVSVDSYLNDVLPYHVKHILVKTSASSDDYATSAITAAESRNLKSVIYRLANIDKSGETFGTIAKNGGSEDTGSASSYGDLGIMSKNTSFVNEFKLGVYTYDSLFNTEIADTEKTKIGLTTSSDLAESKTVLSDIGLGEIPYGAALLLETYADKVTDEAGYVVNKGKEAYYPRNIIWNQYFNLHNVSVITSSSINETNNQSNNDDFYKTLGGFKDVEFNVPGSSSKVTKNVLCDENGNVILVTRAGTGSGDSGYQGIHFIVVQRSALVAGPSSVQHDSDETTLAEYYTTKLPNDTDFPYYQSSGSKVNKSCYVNYLNDNVQSYISRKDALKTEIKSADPSISMKLFEYFFKLSGAKIIDSTLNTKINDYIYSTAIDNDTNKTKSYNDTWEAYTNMLGVQINKSSRKISTTCAVKFKNASSDPAFEKGGACYYED